MGTEFAEDSNIGRSASVAIDGVAELLDQLERTTQLPRSVLRRVIDEVLDHHRESIDQLVRRRHRELQAGGFTNPAIWSLLVSELATRLVQAPQLSERQLRRIVYG
jgi:hypothetical protein